MVDPSKKILRDGFERLLAKGLNSVNIEEATVVDLLKGIAKSARASTKSPDDGVNRPHESTKSLTEVMFNLAKSVDSFSDLEERLRAHRGEFTKVAKSCSRQLLDVLDHIASPQSPSRGDGVRGEIVDVDAKERNAHGPSKHEND
jgi:hypothetical protein